MSATDDASWTTGGQPDIVHVKRVGYGTFGEVHKMSDKKTKEVFARKIMTFAGIQKNAVDNEIRAVMKLCTEGHKNIVHVRAHFRLKHSISYAIDMEFCDLTLDAYIRGDYGVAVSEPTALLMTDGNENRAKEALKWHSLCKVMKDITRGLEFIHSRGEIHRDLKPSNILYSAHSKTWKIADFGFTTQGSSMRVAVSRNARGTTGYRAPELIKDEQIFTRKVDIWAVGCIFYEIVTRRKAFRDDLETRDYQPSKYPIKFPELDFHYGNSRQFFPETVKKTLRLEFADRPSADRLLESFRDFDGHLFTAPKRVSSTAPKPPLGPKSSRGKIHPPIISKTQLSPLGNSALAYQPLPIAMPVGSAPRSNFHHDAMSPMQNIAIISPLPPFGSSSALPLPTPYVPAMPNVRVPSPFPTMSSPSGLGSVDPSLHIQNTFWPQH